MISARALAARGLADVRRRHKGWTATITDDGRYFLAHGHPPSGPMDELQTEVELRGAPRAEPPAEGPPPDVTVRAMHRVKTKARTRSASHQSRRALGSNLPLQQPCEWGEFWCLPTRGVESRLPRGTFGVALATISTGHPWWRPPSRHFDPTSYAFKSRGTAETARSMSRSPGT